MMIKEDENMHKIAAERIWYNAGLMPSLLSKKKKNMVQCSEPEST
jgi:hypothetical protein